MNFSALGIIIQRQHIQLSYRHPEQLSLGKEQHNHLILPHTRGLRHIQLDKRQPEQLHLHGKLQHTNHLILLHTRGHRHLQLDMPHPEQLSHGKVQHNNHLILPHTNFRQEQQLHQDNHIRVQARLIQRFHPLKPP